MWTPAGSSAWNYLCSGESRLGSCSLASNPPKLRQEIQFLAAFCFLTFIIPSRRSHTVIADFFEIYFADSRRAFERFSVFAKNTKASLGSEPVRALVSCGCYFRFQRKIITPQFRAAATTTTTGLLGHVLLLRPHLIRERHTTTRDRGRTRSVAESNKQVR